MRGPELLSSFGRLAVRGRCVRGSRHPLIELNTSSKKLLNMSTLNMGSTSLRVAIVRRASESDPIAMARRIGCPTPPCEFAIPRSAERGMCNRNCRYVERGRGVGRGHISGGRFRAKLAPNMPKILSLKRVKLHSNALKVV